MKLRLKSYIFSLITGVLLLTGLPVSSYAQFTQIMQDRAVANGNGETLNTKNQATATLTVNCSGCSGGTLINFEGTSDNTNYNPINATLTSAASAGTSTSSSSIQVWVVPVAGLSNIRARISAYSAGTVSVFGVAVKESNGGGGSGGGGGIISGTVGIDQATAHANEVVCISGCSGGTTDTDDGTIATGQSVGLSGGLTMVFDGTNWKRFTVGTAGTAAAQVVTVQGVASMTPLLATLSGTNNINNISGTVSLPTGASTAAKQPALGTAGTASADVITVQGVTSMTPLLATLSGTNNINNISGTISLPTGAATVAKQPALGTAGTAASDVITIQGIASMTPLLVAPPTADASEGAAVATTPVPVGCVYRTLASVVTLDNGDIGYLNCGPNNELVTSPYSTRTNDLVGVITSAMTGTTSTVLTGMDLQGSGIRVYVTACEVHNADDTTDTEVVLQDGSGGATLYTLAAAHNYGGAAVVFPNPIHTTANTGLYAANVTTGATTKISCTGFKGK